MIQKLLACLREKNYGGFIILWHRGLFRHAEVHASVTIGSILYIWNLMEVMICFRIFNLVLITTIEEEKVLDCSAKEVHCHLTSNLRPAKRPCKPPLTSMTLHLPTYTASCSDIFCAVFNAIVCIWPQYFFIALDCNSCMACINCCVLWWYSRIIQNFVCLF
jgi:hypothetical protein